MYIIHDPAEDALNLPSGYGVPDSGKQRAVGVVLLGGQDHGDVVDPVPGREVEGIFGRVVDDVHACLALVCVLCCLLRLVSMLLKK